jgi:hypothetical protein
MALALQYILAEQFDYFIILKINFNTNLLSIFTK